MPESEQTGFWARAAAKFWPFWLFYVRRYAWLVLVLLIVTSFFGYRYGRGIRIDTNLLHLLPSDTESLTRLNHLRESSEIRGFLIATWESHAARDPAELTAAARRLEETIRTNAILSPVTHHIIYEVPGNFLLRHALYYADTADLVRVKGRLEKAMQDAKRRENPYFEDLEQVAPARFYIGDILNKYRKRYLSGNTFISQDRRSISVLLSLKRPPDDIQFGSTYMSLIGDHLASYGREHGLKLRFSGRYASDVEKQKQLAADINQSTTITLLILLASLIVFFRSLRTVLVIGLPVAAALGYTYHAAWFFIGQISVISSFLTSILLGLGIDYGIHLFARYKNERLRGNGMTIALEVTMRNLFRGLSFGMISTAAVFLTLSFSRFIAFAEFGKIALAGVIFFFLSFILFFPALVFLTEKYSVATTEPSHMLEKTRKTRGWHILVIASVIIYGLYTLFKPPFEYDFFELEHTAVSRETASLHVLENREHMVVYEFASLADLAVAEAGLRKRISGIPVEFHSIRDLIPEDAGRKEALIGEMRSLLRQAEIYSMMTFDTENLRKIRLGLSMTEASPPGVGDIPEAFRQHLVMNGKYYLYIFPRDTSQLKRGALDFAAAFREACTAPLMADGACPVLNRVRGISDLYVLDDILGTVLYDLIREIFLISLVIAMLVLSMTRRFAGMALILVPLMAGILGLFALIGFCHHLSGLWLFEFNYINLLAIPILLGVGIDNGIYLYSHARELGLSQVNHIMVSTGGSIFISNFTTAMGFLSLTISSHIGLASFGFLTFAGMLCVFYSYRVLFPALARFFEKLEAEI